MKNFLSASAPRIWPDFNSLQEPDRLALLQELFGILFGLPFLVLAVVWLVAATNPAVLREQWPVLLLMLGLSVLAGRLSFYQITVGSDENYSYNGSSLEIVIVLSGMFLFSRKPEDNLSASVSAIQDAVLAAVEQFSVAGAQANSRQRDDETLVIIKRQ